MRADRMRGFLNGPLDNAYATLAQLKVALPIAQAASMGVGDRVVEGTVLTLIDLTRDLTDRLTESCFVRLSQLDVDRRSRLIRSIAQEVAFLIGRAYERGEVIDASHLVKHIRIALDAIDQVPGAKVSLPFTDTLGARVKWELAVSSAGARLTECMMDDPEFCFANIKPLLSNLLDRVNRAAGEIKTNNDEERLTVRVSLLNHFSKSHARLTARVIDQERQAGRRASIAAVLKKIDVYHVTLSMTLQALDAKGAPTPVVAAAASDTVGSFSPEI